MLVLRAVSLRDGGGTAVHYSVVTHGPHLQCAHASGSSTARTYSHVPALLLETLSSNPVGLKTAESPEAGGGTSQSAGYGRNGKGTRFLLHAHAAPHKTRGEKCPLSRYCRVGNYYIYMYV